MKPLLKGIIPYSIWHFTERVVGFVRIAKCRFFGRVNVFGETAKAKPRRLEEGFFDKFCQGKGIDIGYGGDLLTEGCAGWDLEHGDAHYLKGVENNKFDFVYASHVLEHMSHPHTALKNWWRVLKPGGFLIISVPDRDLYEKKKTLPSRFNADHKKFFLLERDEKPDTIGLIPLIKRNLDGAEIVYGKVCDAGYTISDPGIMSDGEFSVEVVVKKVKTEPIKCE